MPDLAVILPAAGSSTRFGRDKLSEDLLGRSILQRCVDAFAQRTDVGLIVLVGRDWSGIDVEQRSDLSLVSVPGGPCRAQSVLAGLKTVPASMEWVAIHDAARPLVSQNLIDRTLQAAKQHGAAAPAMPVHLTIKQAEGPLPAKVQRTIPREDLWAMQTPQILRRADLLEAFRRCPLPLEQITDDIQLLELIGKEVWLVSGEERNLKITSPIDLEIAKQALRSPLPQGEG